MYIELSHINNSFGNFQASKRHGITIELRKETVDEI